MSFFNKSKPAVGQTIVETHNIYRPIQVLSPWQQQGLINQPPAHQMAKGYAGLQLHNGLESYTTKFFEVPTAYGTTTTNWQPTQNRQNTVQLNPNYPKGGGPVTTVIMKQNIGAINAAYYGQNSMATAAAISGQVMGGLPNG